MAQRSAGLIGLLSFAACAAAAAFAGCGNGDGAAGGNPTDLDASLEASGASSGDASHETPGCSTYPGHDPSLLPGAGCCAAGPSHCVPASDLPPSLTSAFAACSGGLCVPDPIIRAGSEYVPSACTTTIVVFSDLPGVCLSRCITLVADNSQKDLLHQETCGQGELCVPCTDPTTNKPTGACTITSLVCNDGGASAKDAGGPTCPYVGPPILDPNKFPACSPACNGAHCVPASIVPTAVQAQLASCTSNGQPGFCAADSFIAAAGNGVPKSCASVAAAEGRCLSTCLPAIAAQAQLLPQDVCAADERCAPCYDPVAADPTKPTGACSLACDKPARPPTLLNCPYSGPPVIDPSVFPACSPACGGAHCVPASLVPAADQAQLATCSSNGQPGFCAPDSITSAGGAAVPKTCTSIGGAEGRCLSTCLPAIASQAQLLPQDLCVAGERCAPCYDPVAADPTKPTGACSLACDKPAKPPTILTCPYSGPPVIDPSVFPACSPACGGAHCVPASLIPAADHPQLAACSSSGQPGFCAPDSITSSAGEGVPKTCTSIAGAEGRCLSTCLPAIASQASLLPQSTCAAGERCAPCYDPVASDPTAPTGACSLGCDKPARPPTILTCPWNGAPVIDPSTLPACDNGGCGGSHCLPAAEVPLPVQSQLARCGGGAGFCTPDPIIATADRFVPTSCDPFPGTGAPGRCLSGCLPAVAKEAASGAVVQSSCATGAYCVPCNDPFTGASTGACTLGCDTPPPTPFVFPSCCEDGTGALTGRCVPAAQVPPSQQGSVNQSGNGNGSPCPSSAASYLCVPDEYLPAPYNTIPLQSCQATFLNLCGTCVSQCVVNGALNFLGSDDCAAHHKCVPCAIAGSTPGCSTFC